MTARLLPLFDGFLPAPVRPEDRAANLAALPAPVGDLAAPMVRNRPSPVPALPRAIVDPVGHLSACKDGDCQDCDALYQQGFRQCAECGRWTHRACQYEGRCSACQIASGGELDGREVRYEWTPPAALRRS